MTDFAMILVALPLLLFLSAYLGYPALLRVFAAFRDKRVDTESYAEWPHISISLPVYNEQSQIREVLESLLAIDYPAERRQIVVVSDASSDGTDAIVTEYASHGVELFRLPERAGKTAAENAVASRLRGQIIINTDASIRIRPDAVKKLIAQFNDATVGVASGRDISVSGAARDANVSEAGYVGYEMRVRALETRVGGIIGASGCFYAVRAHLHRQPLPIHLSRDFASALIAREHGFRAVSVDEAACLVPRTTSLQREYRRKVRTMSRGMETLAYKSHLLNPLKYGLFAWMLFSHKVCRWLVPVASVVGVIGLLLLAPGHPVAQAALAGAALIAGLALIGWHWPQNRPIPSVVGFITAASLTQVATMASVLRALHGDKNAAWEPTRRETAVAK